MVNNPAPGNRGHNNERVMANKTYRVVACIGRKRNVIFESKAFDPTDGCADYDAFKETVRAREQHCMDLWGNGFSVTNDGRYHHFGKNIDAGRIEIVLSSK